jgi:hypothetical protein
MAAVEIENPYACSLTAQAFARMTPPRRPPIVGDSWRLRLRVADSDGAAMALAITDDVEKIEVFIQKSLAPASVVFKHSSATNRVGVIPASPQVEVDDDQAAETLDGDGNPVSGKGWLELYLDPDDDEALVAQVGCPFIRVVITWASGQKETVLMGKIEIQRAASE